MIEEQYIDLGKHTYTVEEIDKNCNYFLTGIKIKRFKLTS